MTIFPLVNSRVKSCKVLPEVWLSTLGQTSDPSFTWKRATFFKIKDDDADDDHKKNETFPHNEAANPFFRNVRLYFLYISSIISMT